ncbi:MAG: hypothetical protein ACRDE2_13335, partial [Chitinophagaceae bacterium]
MNEEAQSVMPVPAPGANQPLPGPPMQINEGGTGQSFTPAGQSSGTPGSPNYSPSPTFGGFSNESGSQQGSFLNPGAESFGANNALPADTAQASSGNDMGNLASLALTALPFLGPEGLAAKLVIGGSAGLLTGLLSGANSGQMGFDVATGLAGGGALDLLSELIPPAVRIASAGNKINQALTDGETALNSLGQGGKALKLTSDIEKEFGTTTAPNESLMPASTGAERTNLAATLSHEISTIGGGNLANLSLSQLNDIREGYGVKAAFGTSNPTASEKLYRNMYGAMRNVI